jgi:PhoH-like ATPase
LFHRYDSVITIQNVQSTIIDRLYIEKTIPIHDLSGEILSQQLRPNDKAFIVSTNESQTALAIVNKSVDSIRLVGDVTTWGIKPKNREQAFLLKLLQDNDITFQMVLGSAGTGKTILSIAAAMYQTFERKAYKQIVFTKPTYEVGAGPGLGAVPGDIGEKYAPYLINFEQISKELGAASFYQGKDRIEYIPIQRMRGASFIDTIIISDEVQSLDVHEMKTLCTRVGRGSKLVLLGDLEQIDRKIKVQDTGLFKLATSDLIRQSSLCATVELVKNERSEISALLNAVLR